MIIKTALDIDKKQIVLDGCMVAYSGTIINLYAPLSNTYLLEDIAHQLAFNCRWNGATKTYFSVAEHCCMMYDEAPAELKAVALFHDAEEAYWGDIIKPLKNLLPVATRLLMREMRHVIISQFLGEETLLPKELDQLDAKMLGWDFDNLILSDNHKGMDCYTAEKEWLKRAYKVLNSEQTPERSVATELNSSTEPLPNKELPTLEPEQGEAVENDAVAKPKVVCLCGSTRFMEAFQAANLKFTCEGKIVLSVGCNTKSDRDLLFSGELTEELKIKLDELHKRKIDLSDEVFILNVGGYIGESTRSELEYAKSIGKPIIYLEPTI